MTNILWFTKMVQPRFVRHTPSSPSSVTGEPNSSNLYVANFGPAVGLTHDAIAAVFSAFGKVKGVYAAEESGVRVIVSFADPFSTKVNDSVPVSLADSELNIPGLFLLPDFVTAEEEELLILSLGLVSPNGVFNTMDMSFVTGQEMLILRTISASFHRLFVILESISLFPNLDSDPASLNLDQLTVNEYSFGVGLSPHIDTHSAFEDCIYSLSLAGPCIMELRRYSASTWKVGSTTDEEKSDNSTCIKKALYLPPRSMLLLSGEALYAWNHYIPHHKIDKVNDNVIRRSPRRVSFTFRKVRNYPCRCEYPQYYNSQQQR